MRDGAVVQTFILPIEGSAQVALMLTDVASLDRRVIVRNLGSGGASIYLSVNRFARYELQGSTPAAPLSGYYYILPSPLSDQLLLPVGFALFALSDIKPGQIEMQAFPLEEEHDLMGTLF